MYLIKMGLQWPDFHRIHSNMLECTFYVSVNQYNHLHQEAQTFTFTFNPLEIVTPIFLQFLHHTESEYQKLTYSFLLQILQIWYFMVIYRYLIERDISIDENKQFSDIIFSEGKIISEILNSQIIFTL